MRARKPCVLARFRTFGWYVRFNVPPRCAPTPAQSRTSVCAAIAPCQSRALQGDPRLRMSRIHARQPLASGIRKTPQNLWTVWKTQDCLLWNLWITRAVSLFALPRLAMIAALAGLPSAASIPLIFAFEHRIATVCRRHRWMSSRPERSQLDNVSLWLSGCRTFHRQRELLRAFHRLAESSGSKRPLRTALSCFAHAEAEKRSSSRWNFLWKRAKSPRWGTSRCSFGGDENAGSHGC